MENLSNDQEDHSSQQKNSQKLYNETGHTFLNFMNKSMETETTWSEFPNGGKANAEQILASEEINKFKRAGLPRRWSIEKKKSKTLSEVKQVENISNTPHSFLKISLVQKEVFPSHKLQDHAYE